MHTYEADYNTNNFNKYLQDIDDFLGMLQKNNLQNKEFWITEHSSFSQTTSPTQVRYNSYGMIAAASRGIARIFVYSWDAAGWRLWDGPTSGLNAAGIAYREIRDWLLGAVILIHPDGYSVVQEMDYSRVGMSAAVRGRIVFVGDGSQTTPNYTVPPWASTVRLLDGTSQTVTPGATYTISEMPVTFESSPSTLD